MPKSACRLFLRNTGVRVERLQDITEEDAKAEGYTLFRSGARSMTSAGIDYNQWCAGAIPWFNNLWKEINGADSWQANPGCGL